MKKIGKANNAVKTTTPQINQPDHRVRYPLVRSASVPPREWLTTDMQKPLLDYFPVSQVLDLRRVEAQTFQHFCGMLARNRAQVADLARRFREADRYPHLLYGPFG